MIDPSQAHIQLNAPGTAEVPIPTIDCIQITSINAQASNAYNVYLSGARTVRISNMSAAPILVQLWPRGAQMPLVFPMASQSTEQWSSPEPCDSLTLSNMTKRPVPLFGDQAFEGQAGTVTSGQVIICGFTVQMLNSIGTTPVSEVAAQLVDANGNAIAQLPTSLNQVALGTFGASAGATTNVTYSVTPDVNGIFILLGNSANVSRIKVAGVTTGVAYYDQTGPGILDQIACAVDSTHDTQITISITMPAAQTCLAWVSGRRDSFVSATLEQGQAVQTVQGTVNVGNTPNVQVANSRIPSSLDQVLLATINTPSGSSLNTNIPVSADINSLLIVQPQSQNMQTVLINGHVSGALMMNCQSSAGDLLEAMVSPVGSAVDTSVDVLTIVLFGQPACTTYVIGMRDSNIGANLELGQGIPNVSVSNQPGGPVTNQPTVLPGNSAASATTQVSGATPSAFTNLGASFARPSYLFSLEASWTAFVTGGTVNSQIHDRIWFGVQGTTTLVRVYLAIGTYALVLSATGGNGATSGHLELVFPFPIRWSSLLPSDATVQMFSGIVAGALGAPAGDMVLFTG